MKLFIALYYWERLHLKTYCLISIYIVVNFLFEIDLSVTRTSCIYDIFNK